MSGGRGLWRLAVLAASACVILAVPAVAAADGGDEGPAIVVADGVTQPVFGYADATRQRVWVEGDFDTNLDGIKDRIAMDIIRPKASDSGLKVPVIMDASPYYSTLGRGNESELKRDLDGDGLLDRWPLFYDNYFVPRGYAVVLLDMVGTNNSTGCPQTGDPAEHLSAVVGIDWLNGRRAGFDKDGNQVFASWHNGKTGMIGKSYDGTLANGAASTGVDGLSTIVPISAISSWYDYVRSNGLRVMGNNYPSSLSNTVTDPADRPGCATVRLTLDMTDGDETADYTPFWAARDYNPDVDKVKASVFAVHGINDNNVKPDHMSKWWYGLAANDVPRKLWVTQTGHIDPFDFRRTEWVSTLHRWFDYWLQDVQTGIMKEPEVDFERSAETWEVAKTWPAQNSTDTNLWLQPSETPGTFGTLTKQRPSKKQAPATFLDNPTQSQANMISITAAQGAEPAGLPVAAAAHRPALLRHASCRARRVRRPDGHELRPPRRRLRHRRAGAAHERRRPPDEAAQRGAGDLLGRGEPRLGRGRVLPADDRAADHRVAGARHEGHPRCPEPELVRDRPSRSWSASRTGSTSRCCPRTTSSRPDTASASWSSAATRSTRASPTRPGRTSR